MAKNAPSAAAATAPAPVAEVPAPATAPAPEAPATVAAAGPPKTFVRTMVKDGATDTLEFNASLKKGGKYNAYVVLRTFKEVEKDGKKSLKTDISKRGASAEFSDLAAAKEYLDGAVKTAVTKGWKEKTRGPLTGGFTAKPDAFGIGDLPSAK